MGRMVVMILGVTAIAAGCGSVIDARTGATSGTGGATTTSATASAGGSGGATTITSSSTACTDPTVFFDVEADGQLEQLDTDCPPDGHLVVGGGAGPPPPPPPPNPVSSLSIRACIGQVFTIDISARAVVWPGVSTTASVTYLRGTEISQEMPVGSSTLTVTSFGDVGGVIEGTFSATVFAVVPGDGGGAPLMITGKFRVCRTPDIYPV